MAEALRGLRLQKAQTKVEFFLQQLVNGITLGGVYALVALGYTMVYGIIQLINFAHGEIYAAGGYMGVILISWLFSQGYPPAICLGAALVLAMGYCALLAMAVEKIAYKPLRQSSRLSVLLSALGMSIFLQNGLMLTQGVYDRAYPGEMVQGGFEVGGAVVSWMQVIIVSVTIVLLLALNLLVFKTRIGKAMRATAQDKTMAQLVGVNINQVISMTFIIGSSLAAVGGVLIASHIGQINFAIGFLAGIKAFTAAVLGGIGSVPGAMLGGLFLGLSESFATGYISSDYEDVFAFTLLVVFLIFRPSGIMGKAKVEKV